MKSQILLKIKEIKQIKQNKKIELIFSLFYKNKLKR